MAEWVEFVRFAWRNPSYVTRQARSAWATHKAMEAYKRGHPYCEYCGRHERLEVHHVVPVSVAPALAADKKNLMVLCRKPPCHQMVGHDGDFGGRYVENPKELIAARRVVKVMANDRGRSGG